MQIYKFRNCFLNTTERRVIKDGEHLDLTPRDIDVLLLLIESSGEIVTKDEMLGKVWNGSFVEEGNLPVHISRLRRSLRAGSTEHYIETVQGTGYRFVAPVETVTTEEWSQHISSLVRVGTGNGSDRNCLASIAILPLQNESGDEEIEYLADGFTESLINGLSRQPELKVLARNTVFRYKNKDHDAKEIGETLGVSTVLIGRINLAGDNLLVSVELVQVDDGTQVWGDQFNRPFSEIIKIQDEITSAVKLELSSKFKHGESDNRSDGFTQNSESYKFYLKGKYFFEKHSEADIYKAIELFQKSIAFDPTNIHSYVETAECYLLLYNYDYILRTDSLAKIEPLLQLTSETGQTTDVFHCLVGGIKMYLEWKFEESEKGLRQALKLNPNNLLAHYRYAKLLMYTGRFPESLVVLNDMMRIDPLSVLTYKYIGRSFYCMGRYENAIMYIQEVLELEPTDHEALFLLGVVLTEQGKFDEAILMLGKAIDIQPTPERLSMIGYAYALKGENDKARQIIAEIKAQSKNEDSTAWKLAKIYLALGEKDMTYAMLDTAFQEHEVDLIGLGCFPWWKSIRHEPRFKKLMRKVGLPISPHSVK